MGHLKTTLNGLGVMATGFLSGFFFAFWGLLPYIRGQKDSKSRLG